MIMKKSNVINYLRSNTVPKLCYEDANYLADHFVKYDVKDEKDFLESMAFQISLFLSCGPIDKTYVSPMGRPPF